MHSFNLFCLQKWRNPSLTISSKLYFSRSKRVASGRPMRTTFNPAFTQPAVRLSTSNKKIQKISEFFGEFLRALRKLRDVLDQVERLQCWSRRSKARGHAGRPSSHEPTARPWWFSPHRVAPESRTNASTEKECVVENWSFLRLKRNAKTFCNILKPWPISLFPMLNTSMQHDEPLQPSWQCLQPAASRALLCDSLHSSQFAVLREEVPALKAEAKETKSWKCQHGVFWRFFQSLSLCLSS